MSGAAETKPISKLVTIPSCAGNGVFSSITDPFRPLFDSLAFIQEGYDRRSSKICKKLRTMLFLFKRELLQLEYTFGKPIYEDPYTVKVVQGLLTRNIGAKFAEVQDEIIASCEELLPSTHEWELANLQDVMMPLVARTTFMEPLIGNILTPSSFSHLVPIIENDWRMKNGTVKSGLRDREATATSSRRTVDDLVLRFLSTNFGAIHTTSMTVTAAISSLGVHPEYIPEFRQEIASVVAEHGWTKAAMGQMRKLDSFLMESQRMYMYFAYRYELPSVD
ncbi:hypothetical protein D9757_010520 [Collybiopsis confluens]|uniref:Cytochrome P450 n=1 Tax=Collybiopsis confluens TaxID=2823264 RepID=A0A8H5LSX3_9AGAR|nr:hypothetical protein D9757_010520 [Collybiopsis confluens]